MIFFRNRTNIPAVAQKEPILLRRLKYPCTACNMLTTAIPDVEISAVCSMFSVC